jgi:hypothetical protein
MRCSPDGPGAGPAAPHEGTRDALACLGLHRGSGLYIDPGGGMEDDARRIGLEYSLDDHAVELQVGIDRAQS